MIKTRHRESSPWSRLRPFNSDPFKFEALRIEFVHFVGVKDSRMSFSLDEMPPTVFVHKTDVDVMFHDAAPEINEAVVGPPAMPVSGRRHVSASVAGKSKFLEFAGSRERGQLVGVPEMTRGAAEQVDDVLAFIGITRSGDGFRKIHTLELLCKHIKHNEAK